MNRIKRIIFAVFWLPARIADKSITMLLGLLVSQSKMDRLLHLDIEERYKPVVHEICKVIELKKGKYWILDVGSGSGGVALFLPGEINRKRIVLCDLDKKALKEGAKITNAIPVIANASKLPFRKSCFSAVVCVHALEHIPKGEIRDESIKEMNRVAKDRLLIEGPFGKNAEKLSRYFIGTLKKLGRAVTPVAIEHIKCGLPEINHIVKFCKGNICIEDRRNFWVEYFFSILSHIPFWRYASIILWYCSFKSWNCKAPFIETFVLLQKQEN